MDLWRISNHASLAGLGAALASGRWHTRGAETRMVYLAEHPAVALIENLVNLDGDPGFFPDTFQLLRISADEGLAIAELAAQQLEKTDLQDAAATRSIGDAWLAAGATALLRVPSIPSPESWNYLLNPRHPDARRLRVEWARRIGYDKRLFHLETK